MWLCLVMQDFRCAIDVQTAPLQSHVLPVAAALALLWLALLLSAPLLCTPLAASLYAMGSLLCHQIPERSFHLFGAQLPVCARCVGIYAGGAAGVLVAAALWSEPRRRRGASFFAAYAPAANRQPGDKSPPLGVTPRAVLVLGALPTALSVAAERLEMWHPSNLARAVAGFPAGVAVAVVVAGAVATLHYGGCTPRRPIGPSHPHSRT